MYAEDESDIKKSEVVLKYLPGELYTIEATDKIPDNCKNPLALIQAAQNQKQTNARGLEKFLMLKIGAKIMLTVNIDIQGCLINDQAGYITHVEFAQGTFIKHMYSFLIKKLAQ